MAGVQLSHKGLEAITQKWKALDIVWESLYDIRSSLTQYQALAFSGLGLAMHLQDCLQGMLLLWTQEYARSPMQG